MQVNINDKKEPTSTTNSNKVIVNISENTKAIKKPENIAPPSIKEENKTDQNAEHLYQDENGVSYILHDKDLTAEISASSTAKGEITIHFQKILMSPVLEILLLNYSFQQKDDAIASFLFSILFLVISMFKMEFLQFDVIHFHISRILVQLFLIFQH